MTVRFPYFTEVFMLLQFCGICHASWWWIVYFIVCDIGTWSNHKKELKAAK